MREKVKTVKGVLQFIHDRLDHELNNVYICVIIKQLYRDNVTNEKLMREALAFFEANQPSEILHTEFFHNPYFIIETSAWWASHENNTYSEPLRFEGANKFDEVEERKRFLQHLIETL